MARSPISFLFFSFLFHSMTDILGLRQKFARRTPAVSGVFRDTVRALLSGPSIIHYHIEC